MHSKKKDHIMGNNYFDERTIQSLGYYVYLLVNPDDKSIFYIGKGTGNRVFNHVNCALYKENESDKLDLIRSIQKNGCQVLHYILRHGLTEVEAFHIEAAILDIFNSKRFNLLDDLKLTNVQGGHDSGQLGLMSSQEIQNHYSAEELNEISHPVLIININSLYRPDMTKEELYEATRKSWVMCKNRCKKVKFVFAEYRGLILEVYKPSKWDPQTVEEVNGRKKTRMAFVGVEAEKSIRDMYLNKSVAHFKKKGSQNPIRYINC
mgnify:FL=1